MNVARASLLALMLAFAFAALADVAVPPLTGRIVDKTATLSSGDIASLDKTLQDFEARKGSQVAVLIVPTTQPETIEQYSIRVAEAWKIGRKRVDDGAILVVAKDDRKLRIEVGYGLEGALTDVTAKRIIDEVITPKFRSGDFAGGITEGVNGMLRVIDGEPLPAPAQRSQNSAGSFGDVDPVFLIVLMVIVGGLMRSVFGRLFGSLATGGLIAALLWFAVASLAWSAIGGIVAFFVTLVSDAIMSSGGVGRGGWVGGGFSGDSSSGGGFSGGGGSFGGGGASGSW
ncbi:MAG TPA: YgcG family protein [Bradyrhizobium sp.]|nr:YgcG family protein [Bradyrhizobium sp.]